MNNVQSRRTEDAGIEAEIQRKGKTAPRVTPAALASHIASVHYFTAMEGVTGAYQTKGNEPEEYAGDHEVPRSLEALGLLTLCVLVLRNGFTVTGESACASPENFDAEIGRKIARQNAEQKIWPLMGYELKCRLAAE